MSDVEARVRPRRLEGATICESCGCGDLYIVVNRDDEGNLFEVFVEGGKAGSCLPTTLGGLGIAVSIGLRCGVDPSEYTDRLIGFRCPQSISPALNKGKEALSCVDVIAKVIREEAERGEKPPESPGVTFDS